MLGRQVGSSLLRLPSNARLVLRPAPFQCQHDLPSRALVLSTWRSYATPGRPRKAVGEPSRPVKRAVKRAAKSSAGGEAKSKVQAKKTAATAKKPAAKKKKAAPKKKPAKKALTEQQKEALQVKQAKAKITDLKKAALSPPKRGTGINAHTVFTREKMKGAKVGAPGSGGLGEMIKSVNEEWRGITSADLEHYNHLAQSEKEDTAATYKRWVESHTPEQIQLANRARRQLKRKMSLKKGSRKYSPIKDERAVKRPLSAYMQFSINRQASGDFRNIPVSERTKLIAQEWKALNESEKKKYKDLQSEDNSRYVSEYNNVFGHDPPAQQAAAGAA